MKSSRSEVAKVESKIYKLKNKDADNLIAQASSHFSDYTNTKNNDPEGAQAALQRYASALIREETRNHDARYNDAKKQLEYAVDQYETFLAAQSGWYPPATIRLIHTELQRALSLLGHVALELNDGELLEATAQKQLISTDYESNAEFQIEALTFQYHVCMSRNQIDEAETLLNEISLLAKKHNLITATDDRHLAKINILKLSLTEFKNENLGRFFSDKIQDIFWTCFDSHKEELKDAKKNRKLFGPNLKRINKNILDDLSLLVVIKTVQRLYGLNDNNPDESIMEYIQRQTRKIYSPNSKQYEHVMEVATKILERIRSEGGITMAHPLFENESPARIAVSAEDFKRLFPDMAQDLSLGAESTVSNKKN